MVYSQPRILPRKWGAQNSLGLWDTNGSSNLNQTTRPSDSLQPKGNPQNSRRCHSSFSQSKTERKRKGNKYIDLAWELKKPIEYKSDGDTSCNVSARYSRQMISTGLEDLKIRRLVETIQLQRVEIGQNTEKSPRKLWRFAVIVIRILMGFSRLGTKPFLKNISEVFKKQFTSSISIRIHSGSISYI